MNAWPELSPEASAQVEAAVASGRKIEAIKMYRNATNCGLKEAKEAVERGQLASGGPLVSRAAGTNWFMIILAAMIVLTALAFALTRMKK